MKLLRVLSTICSLALAIAPAAGQPPLAEKIPAEAIVYAGWAGRSLTFDGSLFGQMLAEQEVSAFLAGSRAAVADGLSLAEADRAILDELWAMGGIAWRHPAALGIYSLPAAAGAEPPKLVAALVVDLQKDRADFERRFQTMLASARQKAGISEAAVGTTPYYRFGTRLGSCGMGFVGDMFFLAIGEEAPERVVALAAGKGKSLAKAPEFGAAMKGVADEGAQAAVYVDLVRLRKAAEACPPPAVGADVPAPVRLAGRLKAVGLDRATALAGVTSIVDRCMYQKIRLFTPAEHRGLLTALSGPALPPSAMASVPADADLVLAVRQDPQKVLKELPAVLAALDGQTNTQLGQALEWARQKLGLDIPGDLLAHLGDEWVLVSAPSRGGVGTGTVLSVSVQDEAKLTTGLDRLAAALDRVLAGPAAPGEPTRGYRVVRSVSGGVSIHHVACAGEAAPLPVAPAWAVHKGRFYLAAFPQVVAAAVTRGEAKGLDQQADFAVARKRMPAGASVLVYVNTPHVLEHLYGAALLAWTSGANRATARGPMAVSPALLPPMPRLSRYARPDMLAVTADAEGVTLESVGSLPGGGVVLAVAPLQLAAGRILPPLRRWAEQAPMAESMAQLRLLGAACALYADRNRGQYPPEIKTLVDQGLLKGGSEELAAMEYLAAMATSHSPPDLLVAYRRPAEAEQAVVVLYRDGNVMRVSRKRFQEDLARTRKHLDEQGK